MNWIKTISLLSIGLLLGCQGDAGKPGISLLGNDLQPPIVSITHPLINQPISDSTIVELHITEYDSIDRVEFLVDGELTELNFIYSIGQHWQFLWDLGTMDDALHTLQALAYDRMNRVGFSPTITFKTPMTESTFTHLYYSDEGNNSLSWEMPNRQDDRYTGYGVRFTPGKSCKIEWVNVFTEEGYFKDLEPKPKIEIWSIENGMPVDTIITASYGSRLRDHEFTTYFRNYNIIVSGEFFVGVTFLEAQEADTVFAVLSDLGRKDNQHSYVRFEDNWQLVEDVTGRPYNFFIETNVKYDY